jgi:DNA-binding transcriptional regulator YdaS (Cro superfamily)
MNAHARFRAWVDSVGSQKKAGDLIGVRQVMVSGLCREDDKTRLPGIETALNIERATASFVGGPIRVADWIPRKRTKRRGAEPADAKGAA